MAVNPFSELRVVRCNLTDPEPAVEKMDFDALKAYITTRDPAKLELLEGVNPVWFTVKRLPQAFVTGFLASVYPLEARRAFAFRAAMHAVEGGAEGPLTVSPKGSDTTTARFVATEGDFKTQIAPEAWVEAIAERYGSEVVQELGQVALELTKLPLGKRGPFSYWVG